MRFILICLSLLFPITANALNAQERMHADSAFLFANRGEWEEASSHAILSREPLIANVVEWMYCKSSESGASFDEISRFLRAHPDWPDIKSLHLRAEQALLRENKDANTVRAWFTDHAPFSGAGKMALAETGDVKAESLLREGWRDGDFDEATEIRLYASHSARLRPEDHFARASRLLWEEKSAAALRMLPYLSAANASVITARLALSKNAPNANALITAVPNTLQRDPGLLFDRIKAAHKADRKEEAERLLLEAPADIPFAQKWWPIREKYIRQALEQKRYQVAKQLLDRHGQTEGKEVAEALWLKGWVALQFLKSPQAAYKDFYQMHGAVLYPVSKARAAYWAGRAAERNGNQDIARNWLEQARAYPSTFYGQLAAQQLDPNAPLALPPPSSLTATERTAFRQKELARIIVLLLETDQNELAYKFTLHLVDKAKTVKDAALAADLGIAAGHREDGVKAAKRAYQNKFLLIKSGYPYFALPTGLPIEAALTFAITRQESEFDMTARSPSNALGLMQLLPGTAKETAGKIGLGYSEARLFEAAYNLTLGSHYLDRLITQFEGSYVKAIAAYNAGPRRVRQWENSLGEPGNNLNETIDWIESIPYAETRNYVHRVLENLQIYRHIMAKNPPPLRLAKDLNP